MVQRSAWGLAVLVVGLIGLAAGWFLRSATLPPPSTPPAPQAGPVSDASCLADERASRGSWMTSEAKPTEAASRPGRVRGRVWLPWQERRKASYAYAVYAFGADGRVEGPKTVANSDRFELSGLRPGRQAILFYPLLENLSFPYQVVDVPANGEVEVALRPSIPFLLGGRVVDASGRGVGGVMVVAHESIQLANDLYLQARPAAAAAVEKTSEPVVTPVSPQAEAIVTTYVRIDPLAGRLSRGVTTDAKGQFELPVTSATDPVPLTISRSPSDVLKEETVLPGAAGVRIVVPNQ